VFKILGQPSLAAVFGVLSLVSLPFLAIVIRRLLCVPDYKVSSLNSHHSELRCAAMCNLLWCYTFCTDVTLFALVLHLNFTTLSQSSNFFMNVISASIMRSSMIPTVFKTYDKSHKGLVIDAIN